MAAALLEVVRVLVEREELAFEKTRLGQVAEQLQRQVRGERQEIELAEGEEVLPQVGERALELLVPEYVFGVKWRL